MRKRLYILKKRGRFSQFVPDLESLKKHIREMVLAGRGNEAAFYEFLKEHADELKEFLITKPIKAARIHSYYVTREDIVKYVRTGKVRITYSWPTSYFKYSSSGDLLEVASRVTAAGGGFLASDEYGNVTKNPAGVGFLIKFRLSDVDIAVDIERLSRELGVIEGTYYREVVVYPNTDTVVLSSSDVLGVVVKESGVGVQLYSNDAIMAGELYWTFGLMNEKSARLVRHGDAPWEHVVWL